MEGNKNWWNDIDPCFYTGGQGGGQIFYVVGGEGHDVDADVNAEMYSMSEANFLVNAANILVSKASKLSAGARIFRGP